METKFHNYYCLVEESQVIGLAKRILIGYTIEYMMMQYRNHPFQQLENMLHLQLRHL
jgi:hypothetical protein